jgi:BirA family biotin operon repressor/biotin-[acetyl-CoA-carboxylase] ligase
MEGIAESIAALESCLAQLVEHGVIAVGAWPDEGCQPADLGLVVAADEVRWSQTPDLLDALDLEAQLDNLRIRTCHVTDSTNTQLIQSAQYRSIEDELLLAEFQFGGRGRRGRSWLSPYGRNLSLSLGMATARDMSQLGGLSIVVGVAIASQLQQLGVQGVQLKWPNDVLVNDEKICGILVELLQRGGQVEYVVGVGMNVTLTDAEIIQIEQPVTDLRRHGIELTRTELVIRVVKSVQRHLLHFERNSFAPFIQAFNELHKFHNLTCRLVQPQGDIVGKAVGIGESGELLLDTANGVQAFHGGEVSLRGR